MDAFLSDDTSILGLVLLALAVFIFFRVISRVSSYRAARRLVRTAGYQQHIESMSEAEGLTPYGRHDGVPATRQEMSLYHLYPTLK